MNIRPSLAFLAAIAALLISAAPSLHAEPGSFKELDLELVQALKEPPGKRALELFGATDQHLIAINKSRPPQPKNATDLDVTVRASLIDSMRDVVALDMSKSTLESVRAQVKSLDLVRSLWDAANVKQAEKTPELDALVTALYDRLVATGALDRNATLSYGVPQGDALIYRIFVLGEDRNLSAFELTGNRAARKATWRETRLPARATALMTRVASIIGAPAASSSKFPAAGYPYVLVLGGLLALEPASEGKLKTQLEKLPGVGVIPMLLEAQQRSEPILQLPSLAASPEIMAGLSGATAILLHRASGAELARWSAVQSLRDLEKVTTSVTEIANEVSGDLGRTVPAAGASSPQLASLIAPLQKAPDTGLVSVGDPIDATPIGGGRPLRLTPDTPLRLHAVLAESDWGQYAVATAGSATKSEADKEPLFWLRAGQVGKYVPPKPAPDDATDEKSGARQPDAKTKSEKPKSSGYFDLGKGPGEKAKKPE